MTLEQIKKLIDELVAAGTMRIAITGGEPLIRDDIGEIIDYIAECGIETVLLTNGSFVPKKIDALRKLQAVCLSFDGPKKYHDYNRGEGSFDEVMTAMEVLKNNGIRFYTNSVITRGHFDSIDYILKTAEQKEFLAQINVYTGEIGDDLNSIKKRKPGASESRKIFEYLIECKRKGRPVFFSVPAYQIAIQWQNYNIERIFDESEIPKGQVRCHAGRYFCIIDPDGSMYPCPKNVDRFKPVNVLSLGVKEAMKECAKHSCLACYWTVYVEFNLTFGLNFSSVLNSIKNSARY